MLCQFSLEVIVFSFQDTDRWSKVPKEHPTIDAAQPTDPVDVFAPIGIGQSMLISGPQAWIFRKCEDCWGDSWEKSRNQIFQKKVSEPTKILHFWGVASAMFSLGLTDVTFMLWDPKRRAWINCARLAWHQGFCALKFWGPKFRAESVDVLTYFWRLENGDMNQGTCCRTCSLHGTFGKVSFLAMSSTPWKFNSSPLKSYRVPIEKDRLPTSNHHFSGASCQTSGGGIFFWPRTILNNVCVCVKQCLQVFDFYTSVVPFAWYMPSKYYWHVAL